MIEVGCRLILNSGNRNFGKKSSDIGFIDSLQVFKKSVG